MTTTILLSHVGDAVVKTVEDTTTNPGGKWYTTTIERAQKETPFSDGGSLSLAEMKHDQAIELVMHILEVDSNPVYFDHTGIPLFHIFDFERDDVALGENLCRRLIQTCYRYYPLRAAELERDLQALVDGSPDDWRNAEEGEFAQYQTTCAELEEKLVAAINAALPFGIRYLLTEDCNFVFEVPNVAPIRMKALTLITSDHAAL